MNKTIKARVMEIHRGLYIVQAADHEYSATLAGKLLYNEEYPVVGDYVEVVETDHENALIVGICERSSLLTRPDKSGHADGYVKTIKEQVMVANIDYLFIVTSLNDNFNVNRIARYAAIAVEGNCKPVVILTKTDLCEEKEAYIEQVKEINEDLQIICVSSYTGEGIDKVRTLLKDGVTVAFMGSSGVGKSTLINALAGEDIMKVSAIREEDSKGRHTTTHRQMIKINGAYIVDTPGMRELGMCDVAEGVDDTFSDIVDLTGRCRFSNCRHETEPGCAIKAALEEGSLPVKRWELYLSLQRESKWSRGLKKQMMVDISKKRKTLNSKGK